VASWYLTGSHSDGSAIDLSDVDLLCLADPLNTDVYNWAKSAQAPYGSKVDILMLHPTSLNSVLNANAIPMLHGAG
jgi:predicted nucleotidyltransferase